MTDQTDQNDAELGRETLREVMRDKGATASARAQAARTLAEITQMVGRDRKDAPGDPGRDIADMSAADLEAELRALDG